MKIMVNAKQQSDIAPVPFLYKIGVKHMGETPSVRDEQVADKTGQVLFVIDECDKDTRILLETYNMDNKLLMRSSFRLSELDKPIEGIYSPDQINIHVEQLSSDYVIVNLWLLGPIA